MIGCGMLGLTAVAYALDLGASTVIACDPEASRRQLATQLGASITCQPDELSAHVGDDGADVVLELSGHPRAVQSAIDVVGVGGRVALVGSVSPGPAVTIDPESIVRWLTTISGSHNYTAADLHEAISFLARTSQRDQLAALVSEPMRLDQIDAAIAAARAGAAPRVSIGPAHALGT